VLRRLVSFSLPFLSFLFVFIFSLLQFFGFRPRSTPSVFPPCFITVFILFLLGGSVYSKALPRLYCLESVGGWVCFALGFPWLDGLVAWIGT